MKFFEALKYIVIVFLVYLGISLLEIFVLRYLLDMISDDYLVRLTALFFCLFLINPFLTYRITELLPFAPKDLKVANGHEDALRKEVELPED